MPPKVSILLPNLNNRAYLDQRIATIQDQTFSDWELIIVDNYSEDGAWELFQRYAKDDERIKISQAPKAGMYANWNNCIRLAKGEYVYIATSDDTMSHNLIEEMVIALEEHSECDLAHCNLEIIDENGERHPSHNWDRYRIVRYFGERIHQKHIRFAPHDGVLHFLGGTVYISITQLLIRKRIFENIGLFLENYGSIADFEWEMRASLVYHTIHIPKYLATWRVHQQQATNLSYQNSAKHRTLLLEMIDHAFYVASMLRPDLIRNLNIKHLKSYYLKQLFIYKYREEKNRLEKFSLLFSLIIKEPIIAAIGLITKITNSSFELYPKESHIEMVRHVIKKYKLCEHVHVL